MKEEYCIPASRREQDEQTNMWNRIEALRQDLLETVSVGNNESFNSAPAETAARLKDLRKYF